MTALLTLLGAVVTALLAVPAPAGRRLQSRFEPVTRPAGSGRGRRVLAVVVLVLAVAALVSGAGVVAGGPAAVGTASVLLVVGTAARLVAASLRQRRARRAQHDVATACGVLASYLRVGQVATEALLLAAQDCPVLAEAARRQRIGGDVPATWRAQAQSPGHGGLVDLARTWQVSASTGAPLSAALEQVAAGLAADQSLRAVVAGELSAPRATGKVMAVLPLLGIGLGYALGGDPLRWLLARPVGWACLLLGLLLAAGGVTWIERLARDAPPRPDVTLWPLVQPWALGCAASAGLTMFLLVAAPPRWRDLGERPAPRREGRLRRLARGRPDAAPAGRRVLVCALAAVALCALVTRFAPSALWCWALAPLVSAFAAVGLGWLEPAAARRRRHQLVLQTPQALELLAACLAAGLPVRRACSAVVEAFDGPVAEDLGRVAALTALGVGDADAWHTLAAHPQLGPAAADLARSVESGTLLVEGLRHHAARARDQRQAALQVLARSVGVRSVLPLMACFIPSFVLLGVVPSVASALSHALHL